MLKAHRPWLPLLCFILLALAWTTSAAAAETTMPTHTWFTIASTVLKEARHINVYTPPGYAAHKSTRYLVLYMPDGGMREDFPHVAMDIDTGIRAGKIQPMIVIGIENTERRRDMTGPTTVSSDREIAPHVGGSAAFRAFIADELMPQVRQRYRTNGRTAIVGESLAGLFVVETFIEQPLLFDTAIAFSPSLWWNNASLAHGAATRLRASPSLTRTLYLANASDDDIGDGMRTLRAALRANAPKGLVWFYQSRADLHHDTIYRRASPAVFHKLFPPGAR
ncbi:MAG: alpha/beta hydrolase-fold protein [Rhodanobacter sp.]